METASKRKPWVRLYRDSLHNPKIVSLTDRQYRAWSNCCKMAEDDTGALPSMRDIACHLRMTIQEAEQIICDLVEAGLVDVDNLSGARRYKMHDWDTHQYVSDSSTERVRKFREKSKTNKAKRFSNGDETLQKRPQTSDTDTETESLTSVEQESARGKDVKRFNFNSLMKGKGEGDGKFDWLVTRAEGLGIPTAELVAATTKAKPKNKSAYFTKLCVSWLMDASPMLLEPVARQALWGDHECYALVCAALLEGSNAG